MRQARRSRDELRRTLLGEVRATQMEEGLDAGSSNLGFKWVFPRVEEKMGTRIPSTRRGPERAPLRCPIGLPLRWCADL